MVVNQYTRRQRYAETPELSMEEAYFLPLQQRKERSDLITKLSALDLDINSTEQDRGRVSAYLDGMDEEIASIVSDIQTSNDYIGQSLKVMELTQKNNRYQNTEEGLNIENYYKENEAHRKAYFNPANGWSPELLASNYQEDMALRIQEGRAGAYDSEDNYRQDHAADFKLSPVNQDHSAKIADVFKGAGVDKEVLKNANVRFKTVLDEEGNPHLTVQTEQATTTQGNLKQVQNAIAHLEAIYNDPSNPYAVAKKFGKLSDEDLNKMINSYAGIVESQEVTPGSLGVSIVTPSTNATEKKSSFAEGLGALNEYSPTYSLHQDILKDEDLTSDEKRAAVREVIGVDEPDGIGTQLWNSISGYTNDLTKLGEAMMWGASMQDGNLGAGEARLKMYQALADIDISESLIGAAGEIGLGASMYQMAGAVAFYNPYALGVGAMGAGLSVAAEELLGKGELMPMIKEAFGKVVGDIPVTDQESQLAKELITGYFREEYVPQAKKNIVNRHFKNDVGAINSELEAMATEMSKDPAMVNALLLQYAGDQNKLRNNVLKGWGADEKSQANHTYVENKYLGEKLQGRRIGNGPSSANMILTTYANPGELTNIEEVRKDLGATDFTISAVIPEENRYEHMTTGFLLRALDDEGNVLGEFAASDGTVPHPSVAWQHSVYNMMDTGKPSGHMDPTSDMSVDWKLKRGGKYDYDITYTTANGTERRQVFKNEAKNFITSGDAGIAFQKAEEARIRTNTVQEIKSTSGKILQEVKNFEAKDGSYNSVNEAHINAKQIGTRKGYHMTAGGEINFARYTATEVLSMQKQLGGAAIGAYQFKGPTLKDALNATGLWTAPFNQETQDQLAIWLLERRGLSSYLSGKLTKKDFIVNLAHEWAAIPETAQGDSAYQGQGSNSSGLTPELRRQRYQDFSNSF